MENIPPLTAEQSAFLDPGNQALEPSFLDPTMYFGGGATLGVLNKGRIAGNAMGNAYKKSLQNAAKNPMSGGVIDQSKRTATGALILGAGKIADPTFIPSALAGGLGFGIKQPGIGGVVKNIADITKKSAVNVARAKNFRLNKKAGLSDEAAAVADKIATTKLGITKPINNVSKIQRAAKIKDNFLGSDIKDVGKFALDVL